MEWYTIALLIASWFLGFFADNIATWYWAHHKAPVRAKDLVIEGLKDPRLGNDIRPLWGLPSVADIRDIGDRIDKAFQGTTQYDKLEALIKGQASESWRGELSDAVKDMRRQAERLSTKLDNPAALSMTPELEGRITRAVAATVRKHLEENPLGAGMNKGGMPVMPDGYALTPEQQAALVEQQVAKANLAEALITRGADPNIVNGLLPYGEAALRAWMTKSGWVLE